MKKISWRTVLKWMSICLVAAGLILGMIGLLLGGLRQADFLFWKQWM